MNPIPPSIRRRPVMTMPSKRRIINFAMPAHLVARLARITLAYSESLNRRAAREPDLDLRRHMQDNAQQACRIASELDAMARGAG